MNTSTQQSTKKSQATNSAYQPPRRLFTLRKFAEKHSDFTTLSSVTNQVFKARPRQSTTGEIPGNGMLDFGVIVRIGRKVLIDESQHLASVLGKFFYRLRKMLFRGFSPDPNK